jgi:hypothetical protein
MKTPFTHRLPHLIALLAFGFASLRATDIPLTSIEELARRADVVVRGSVASIEAMRDGEGRPYTRLELTVSETWKGPSTNRLTVVQGGSVLGRRQVRVLGEPEFRLGEDAVVFAVFNPDGEAVTLDLARGKFSVRTNAATGRITAMSDGAKVSGGAALPGQTPVALDELRQRVKGGRQ